MPKYKDNRKYSDRAEYIKKAVSNRRRKTKKMAVEYKGGKCLVCRYNTCVSAMTFHHIDPSLKEFGISHRGLARAWEKVKVELDKCVLLCSNCHAEVHEGLVDLENILV